MGGKCLLEEVQQFFYFQNQDEHPTISSANTRGFDIQEKYYICTMFNVQCLFVLSITFQWAFSKTLKKFAITLISVKVYVY